MAVQQSRTSALITEVARVHGLSVVEQQRNDGWHWVDVQVTDGDLIGGSESLTTFAHQHDFKVCSIDFENRTVRLHRQV